MVGGRLPCIMRCSEKRHCKRLHESVGSSTVGSIFKRTDNLISDARARNQTRVDPDDFGEWPWY